MSGRVVHDKLVDTAILASITLAVKSDERLILDGFVTMSDSEKASNDISRSHYEDPSALPSDPDEGLSTAEREQVVRGHHAAKWF